VNEELRALYDEEREAMSNEISRVE